VTIDPGIGFGKTVDHNHALLANLRQFAGLGVPMMVGTSRKSFLRTDDSHADPASRIPGSVASATAAILAGAAMVRVSRCRGDSPRRRRGAPDRAGVTPLTPRLWVTSGSGMTVVQGDVTEVPWRHGAHRPFCVRWIAQGRGNPHLGRSWSLT
jgi:hypothetical protein